MKIKSPLTSIQEVEPLCRAGADELFCGIEPRNWLREYGDFSLNQRSSGANFSSFAEVRKAIALAHTFHVKVHVAVNAFFYTEEQYSLALKIVKDILRAGADGIIFADPVLFLRTKSAGVMRHRDAIIGCDAAVFNSFSARFFKGLGFSRIVLPRSMTISEIRATVAAEPDCEYEVFIIHDLCFFVDAFCTYCKEAAGRSRLSAEETKHRIRFFTSSRIPDRGFFGGCRADFTKQRMYRSEPGPRKAHRFAFWEKKHIQGCGACSLFRLKKMGVFSVKILDRSLPAKEKIRATRFIKHCLRVLEACQSTEQGYKKECRILFQRYFKTTCSRYDCYYPSVYRDKATW